MKYIKLGGSSSEEELISVACGAEGNQKEQIAEFLISVNESETKGPGEFYRKWGRRVVDGNIVQINENTNKLPDENNNPAGNIYIFAGPKPKPGASSIWAAVMVTKDGKELVLLKIVSTFSGDDNDENNLLQDALDRSNRAEIVQ